MTDILVEELDLMRGACAREQLDLLETGSIRNSAPGHRLADGWSTLTFAEHVRDHGGSITSVDLNTSEAKVVLESEGLADKVELIDGDSVKTLLELRENGRSFDLVLLDSGNDPDLIFREYQVAVKMVRHPSLIVVDDVKCHPDSHGTKGELVVPHLEAQGIPFRVKRRWGGEGWIDVVLVDLPPAR
jgi:hypothetical protein